MSCAARCSGSLGQHFPALSGIAEGKSPPHCGDCLRSHQAIEVDCPDDTAAVEFAKQFIDGKDIELWQSNRKVAEFEHKPE